MELAVYKNIFFTTRFYISGLVLVILFVISIFFTPLLFLAKLLGFAYMCIWLFDAFLLFFTKGHITASRKLSAIWSNSDENPVEVSIHNGFRIPLLVKMIDEIPVNFQKRDFQRIQSIQAYQTAIIHYQLQPSQRGVYTFGDIQLYIQSSIGFIQRRITSHQNASVKVYPSFFQLKKYQIQAVPDRDSDSAGHRKYRKGSSTEFDHIKEYTQGDDIRTINWKASARKNNWMVNSYMDEKSQQVICIIDKGRLMKMPFENLTLLDYAIQATLMFSYVALKKNDKVGLVTFADKLNDFIKPSKNKKHFNTILEVLYRQKSNFLESNFSLVNNVISVKGGQRGLLMLFTNFETYSGFERQLPIFKALARKHLLCIVFFENTEVASLTQQEAADLEEVYIQTIADKLVYEKKLIMKELQKNGILAIYTPPKKLTVQVVNKYLDLKAKQII